MNRKLCLLFLVCLVAVVLVKSESSIEVDENGDEYDVKRFNIQGRQLNGGRSQCVETRRKRSPVAAVKSSESDEETNEDNDGYMANAQFADAMLFFSPPTIDVNGNADDDMDDDEEDEDTINDGANTMPALLNMNEEDDEDDYDDDINQDGAETIEVVQLSQLPVLGQLQSQGQSVAAIASSPSLAGYGNAGHISAGNNGILVLESDRPPKVNPNTHAVFELLHPNSEGSDDDDDDYDNYDDDDFDFEEELNPVSTTAIWSTGSDDDYDDYDTKPLKPNKVVKKTTTPRPLKVKKKTTKRPLKTKRKHKKKIANKNKRKNVNKKRPINNKRIPNRNGVHHPPLNKYNRMRRPVKLNNKKKINQNSETKKKHRRQNAKNKDTARKRKNNNNLYKVDNGENTFTRTLSMTVTNGPDDDAGVNCIIIRKDPPTTTTPRPFWNLLGRSANDNPANSSQYGKRKRLNLRFKA